MDEYKNDVSIDKDKKEIDRREFIKKTAGIVLPSFAILGLSLSGCQTCLGTCTNDCGLACSDNCTTDCQGACSDNCSTECMADCADGCKGTCGTSCSTVSN